MCVLTLLMDIHHFPGKIKFKHSLILITIKKSTLVYIPIVQN